MKNTSLPPGFVLGLLFSSLAMIGGLRAQSAAPPAMVPVTSDGMFTTWHTTLNLREYAALKKIAAERKRKLFDLETSLYYESILDVLQAHPDLSRLSSADLDKEVDPIFTQKLKDLVK